MCRELNSKNKGLENKIDDKIKKLEEVRKELLKTKVKLEGTKNLVLDGFMEGFNLALVQVLLLV